MPEIPMANAAALTPVVPKPAHVPDSVVYDFDMFYDPAYVANPHERLLDLHKKAPPVFWTPRQGGHWMLISHAANFKASRDWESFSNQFMSKAKMAEMTAMMPKGGPHIPQAVPINLDPPDHSKFRAPLQGAFSPKAALALRDDVRALANELIDKIVDRGHCEFMAELAEPLPVQVFLKLLGLPLERQAEYRALVRSHLASLASDPATAMKKTMEIAAVMRPTILERRDNPRDDIFSLLWQS
ncbi:MAG: cytochrome P450, partial [Rhodospirillaceae bacterium]